jgi:hypothetical protein
LVAFGQLSNQAVRATGPIEGLQQSAFLASSGDCYEVQTLGCRRRSAAKPVILSLCEFLNITPMLPTL